MEYTVQLETLDDVVYVSICTNVSGKDMNPFFPSPLEQTGFFSFGETTKLDGKHNSVKL